MAENEFKYDVAFSFLAEDEGLASKISKLLEGRLRTFIYSKKQEEIAGTDGEKTFNRIFGEEARIVFVLYRANWGETSWTRIEATAIRNRAYEEGYDFVTFAPLDSPPNLPKWLPKTNIWVGLDRWGIEGAATVIEARVQEAGGSPKEYTLEEKVSHTAELIQAQKNNTAFLGSEAGVKAANVETDLLYERIMSTIDTVFTSQTEFKLKYHQERGSLNVYGGVYSINIYWYRPYVNTLNESTLHLGLYKGNAANYVQRGFGDLEDIRQYNFDFSLSLVGEPRWLNQENEDEHFSTEQLAGFCLDLLLDQIKKA